MGAYLMPTWQCGDLVASAEVGHADRAGRLIARRLLPVPSSRQSLDRAFAGAIQRQPEAVHYDVTRVPMNDRTKGDKRDPVPKMSRRGRHRNAARATRTGADTYTMTRPIRTTM